MVLFLATPTHRTLFTMIRATRREIRATRAGHFKYISSSTPVPFTSSSNASPPPPYYSPPPQFPPPRPPLFHAPPHTSQIFCNRSLNMASIQAIGFDMDYTLAQYKPETFETLAFYQTIEKLILYFGYPESLRHLVFDWKYMARGLVIDKKRGNILKIDRHKYVKLAYHGFKELERHERMSLYNSAEQRYDFEEPDHALIDTLFSLAEAHLFMQLVEIADSPDRGWLPVGKQYADLYRDVRGAVDLCHRDGSIKREVAREPGKYIHYDPGLVPLLQMMRDAGKKTFLATNSLYDYTNVVMNFLLEGKQGADRDTEWIKHFDVVVTGTGKPRFFTERKDLFAVDPVTGALFNTEGGSPMVPIGDDDLPTPLFGSTAPKLVQRGSEMGRRRKKKRGGKHQEKEEEEELHQQEEEEEEGLLINPNNTSKNALHKRVFQGGFYLDLHKALGVNSGSQVLYVGDHIMSDILRSKKTLGWRTMLVVPELEYELQVAAMFPGDLQELAILRAQRDAVDDQIQRIEWENTMVDRYDEEEEEEEEEEDQANTASVSAVLVNLKEQRDGLKARHRDGLKARHSRYHPVWGELLKTGYSRSMYSGQIERFACLYTSHVTNMLHYPPSKSFKARTEKMAHEEREWWGGGSTVGSGD